MTAASAMHHSRLKMHGQDTACGRDRISEHGHVDVMCPQCGTKMQATVWTIIDEVERPELIAALAADNFGRIDCGTCNREVGRVGGPLLIRQQQRPTDLLYVPSSDQNVEYSMGYAKEYLDRFDQRVTAAGDPHHNWTVNLVPRALLPIALTTDREGYHRARERYAEQVVAELQQASEQGDVKRQIELLHHGLLHGNPFRQSAGRAFSYQRIGELLLNHYHDADNLERAIHALQQALAGYAREIYPREWARTTILLASALARRTIGHAKCDYHAALALFNDAGGAINADDPELFLFVHIRRAQAYLDSPLDDPAQNRAVAIAICDDLLAHDLSEHGAEVLEVRNLLGVALMRLTPATQPADFDRAIGIFTSLRDSVDRNTNLALWAYVTSNLAEAHAFHNGDDRHAHLDAAAIHAREAVVAHHDDPVAALPYARTLGDVLFHLQEWQACVDAYRLARAGVERLHGAAATSDARTAALEAGRDHYMMHRAAYAVAQMGDAVGAAAWLDRARARVLRTAILSPEIIERARPTVPDAVLAYESLTESLAETERELSRYDRLHGVLNEDAHHVEHLRAQAIEHQRVVHFAAQAIRDAVTTPDPPDHTTVVRAAAAIAPLVYITYTSAGGVGIIVTTDAARIIWLDTLTETAVNEALYGTDQQPGMLSTYAEKLNHPDDTVKHHAWVTQVNKTLAWAGNTIMQPLTEALVELHATTCVLFPGGHLSLLPLHAAPISHQTASHVLDLFVCTYAPNASALHPPEDTRGRLLAISDPDGSLFFTRIETKAALYFAGGGGLLEGPNATREAITAALPTYAITHFGCHGRAFFNEPLRTGIKVSNGRLTVRELGTTRGASTAILSACEAAIPGIDLPDEAIGLPTAFLQAGYRRIIAPLWVVGDFTTMVLMIRFYDEWRQETPATALRNAQRWLRDAAPQQKLHYLTTIIKQLVSVGYISQEDAARASSALYHLYSRIEPVAWGAFVITGT